MRKLIGRGLALLALGGGTVAAVWAAGDPLPGSRVEQVALQASAVPLNSSDPGANRIGRLLFMGGVEIRSDDRRFGGLSGLLWEPACNRLLAISDTGAWWVIEPVEREGRLEGIGRAWIAPILDQAGKPYARKTDADAESLARSSQGVWVFFEQTHRADHFPGVTACAAESLSVAPNRRFLPEAARDWPANGGMEAASSDGDRLVVIAEGRLGVGGKGSGLWGGEGAPEPFVWEAPEGENATAMDQLDGRTMLVLHRKLSLFGGFSATIVEGNPGDSEPPSLVARLAAPLNIDNMEALAIRKEGERRFVYLVSDDNFRPMQRTLLLKFELLPAG